MKNTTTLLQTRHLTSSSAKEKSPRKQAPLESKPCSRKVLFTYAGEIRGRFWQKGISNQNDKPRPHLRSPDSDSNRAQSMHFCTFQWIKTQGFRCHTWRSLAHTPTICLVQYSPNTAFVCIQKLDCERKIETPPLCNLILPVTWR